MAGEASMGTTHWAVLIGINFYVGDRCLYGSVRDVETAKEYLEAGPTPVDIAILTATTPPDPGSRRPIENSNLWPTYQNVIAKLMRVLEKAKRGDFVYIHYSGHGTRIENAEKLNLAFVLFEDNEHGSSYLRGLVFASCLLKMVTKGLLVTAVLDCCYSGSVLRDENIQGVSIRAVDYNPAVDAAFPQEPYAGPFNLDNILRNAQLPLEQWLINPDGYTILAASGPHEKAWELEIEGGERRGALTYFLLEALSALRKSGVELTHQSLYQHLRIKFHASWPRQTPMRYGNRNFSFFGKLAIVPNTALIPVYRTDDNRLCLSAGQAHGVHKGDDYVVYPFEASERVASQINEALVKVRIDAVRCFTLDLMGIEPTSPIKQIKPGWKAQAVTCLSPLKVSVRIMESAFSQFPWEEAAQQQRFLHLCTKNDTKPCHFNVTLNENNEYEILDGLLERIVSLPTLPLDTPIASGGIMDVLRHLATYKYFEGVENRTPNPSFERSFSLLPLGGTGSSGTFDVKNGGKWGFTVENLGDEPLYMAIFNFTSSWKIVDLVSCSGGGEFRVIQPKGKQNSSKKKIELRMEVPVFLQTRGNKYCEDILKVFITSRSTSFPSMILPEIPLEANDISKRVRGDDDQLSKFLLELNTHVRSQDHAVHEEWSTQNFIVRTAIE